MKVFGQQILDTRRWDGVGFDREKIEQAVRQYIDLYNQASSNFMIAQSTLNTPAFEQTTSANPAAEITIPLSDPDNPMSPVYIDAYRENYPSEGLGNCRTPTASETHVIGQVIRHINAQLQDWGMANIQLNDQLNQTRAAIAPRQSKISISVCGKPGSVSGYLTSTSTNFHPDNGPSYTVPDGKIVLNRKNNFLNRLYFRNLVAHEFAHMIGTHPQDAINLDQLNPDLLQYMCEQPGHNQLGSVLVYQTECLIRGYDADLFTSNLSSAKFGDLELLQMRRFYGNTETERAENLESAVQKVVQGIRDNYGQKVAGQAVTAFCATAMQRVLQHSVDKSALSTGNKKALNCAVQILCNLFRLVLLSQSLGVYSTGISLIAVPLAGHISCTVQSVARLLSAAGLAMLALSVVRGNSDTLYSMLACLGGQAAGAAAAELVNTLISCSIKRPTEYIDRITARANERRNVVDAVWNRLHAFSPPHVHNSIACLSNLDKAVSRWVDNYARLGFLYEKLPTDQGSTAAVFTAPEAVQANETEQPHEPISTLQTVELVIAGTTPIDQLEAIEEGRIAQASANRLSAIEDPDALNQQS